MQFELDLSQDLRHFVEKCVKDGWYSSPSSMVVHALRLLRQIELCEMYADAYDAWIKSDEGLDWEAVATETAVS